MLKLRKLTSFMLLWVFFLASCEPATMSSSLATTKLTGVVTPTVDPARPTPLPTRPSYAPGTLVDYTVQTGDTVAALASHFNTTVKEIREANPIIPLDATSLPPGMPMKIPIYFQALWGSPFHILADSLYVNGPAQQGFDAVAYVNQQPGWFKYEQDYIGDKMRVGGELVEYFATHYSISPRLLLALIEYQTGALTQPDIPSSPTLYPMGYKEALREGWVNQLIWVCNMLNNGYYGWRAGQFKSFEHTDRRLERPDPWQNAATVSLQYYFSRFSTKAEYEKAVSADGLARTYKKMFGEPFVNAVPHIPGSLRQPTMHLPFNPGLTWAYTGGPHGAYGDGQPLAALDFAPGSTSSGCTPTTEYATAVADGVIARSTPAIAVLDLDGDGDERTGWTLFYLHLASATQIKAGTIVKAGDPIGHPSCEGGKSTGTHVHIARKYNGEWMLAEGPLAYNLDGWVSHNGDEPYLGTLERAGITLTACECSDYKTHIQAGK